MTARKASYFWLIFWFGAALLSQALPQRALEPSLTSSLQGPSLTHWMGFDPLGRDLQFSTLQASLTSAAFASICVALSCAIGVILGALIALSPSSARYAALRVLDGFLAFPSLLLALGLAAVRGPGWGTLLGSLFFGVLPSFVRLIYSRSREILAEPFIEAAKSLGAGRLRILMRHLLPMLGSFCRVKVPYLFAQALLAEATLSFLGVGAPIGHDTWGSLLLAGKDYLFEAPHIAIAAGVPLTLTILSLQTLSLKTQSGSTRSGQTRSGAALRANPRVTVS